VLVIGGGLAGLAAAVGLTQHSVPVVLLESRDRLGGRASSFVDPESGEPIDNCQHVGMGCCTNLQHFCRTVGVVEHFRVEDELTFIDRGGHSSRLYTSWLPCPLHLARAFAGLEYLSWSDKRKLASGLMRLARWRPTAAWEGRSFADWLHEQGHSPGLIESFWEVVLVSALGETLDRIDIGHARKVLVDGFLRHRDGWRVHVPTQPLDLIFGAPLVKWLEDRGSRLRFHAAVRRLIGDRSRITGVELRSGEQMAADEVVLAVPHGRVLGLLPGDVAALPEMQRIQRIESAPISSLHLWFDRPITDLPHAVLIGRLSQWVFRHPPDSAPATELHPAAKREENRIEAQTSATDVSPDSPTPNPHPLAPYQVVISASRALQGRSRDSICEEVLEELRSIWPAAREAQLVRWKLVTERSAVFSVAPGIEGLRPSQQSPVPNLQLAGDWTATGWPATMEGAIRSGYLAAENILRQRGLSAQLLQPDLPIAPLSRWLYGL
jgi:squalene-associated FAD-dependent desaturase